MQIIAIDTGRDKTKIATHNTKLSFKSIVGDWHVRNLSSGGNWEVEINDEKYFIGDLAESESFAPRRMTTKSKTHLETKILFLTALGLTCEDENPYIVTGVPVDQFNPDTKREMLNLLKGEYYIKVNNQSKHLYINDFAICPEGGGTFWRTLNQYTFLEHSKVRIIDLGSRTVNYVTMNNKNYVDKDSGTLNFGMMMMEETSLTHEQITFKVIGDLSKRWLDFDPKKDVVLLTGGGAIPLEKYFKPNYTSCRVVDDPVMANCLGYLKMGELRWQKQTAK